MKTFDRKFGNEFLRSLPTAPGVYRFYDTAGELIYVGKAKRLRRRLSQYRNVKRRKKHLKMKAIVAQADRLEYTVCTDEREALILETRLIQEHRPRWNVAGAFFFLYPMIGMRRDLTGTYLCCTHEPSPEAWPDFEFFGSFRSRHLTREAFSALSLLLRYVGDPVPRRSLPRSPDRVSMVVGFRRIPPGWSRLLEEFWKGESPDAMTSLVLGLVDAPAARRKKREVQDQRDVLFLEMRGAQLS